MSDEPKLCQKQDRCPLRRLDAHIAMLAKSSSRNAHAQAEFNFAEVANA